MKRPREEHDEVLNATKENGTSETIEEPDKLSQTLEEKSVPSVDPSGDSRSVPSYVPSVNRYRAPSEQQFRDLQEEKRKTLEQVKDMENIIASGEIKLN